MPQSCLVRVNWSMILIIAKKKSKNSEAPIDPRLHKRSGVFYSHLV